MATATRTTPQGLTMFYILAVLAVLAMAVVLFAWNSSTTMQATMSPPAWPKALTPPQRQSAERLVSSVQMNFDPACKQEYQNFLESALKNMRSLTELPGLSSQCQNTPEGMPFTAFVQFVTNHIKSYYGWLLDLDYELFLAIIKVLAGQIIQ